MRRLDVGAVLLAAYLGHIRRSRPECERAEGLFTSLADALPRSDAWRLGLYGGVTGVGWAGAHLDRLFGRESDSFEELDEALLRYCSLQQDPFDYDLISGLVGVGVYFLERLPATAAVDGLEQIITALERSAIVQDEGVTWHTSPRLLPTDQRELAPEGYFNLGVAHGVPGVVGLLAQMCKQEVHVNRAMPLLFAAVGWLLAQAKQDGSFPNWTYGSGQSAPARPSWCYGEFGLSVPLLVASEILKEPRIRTHVLNIAAAASERSIATALPDACLCHGAAGNAHIAARQFQLTGDPRSAEAAEYWYSQALSFFKPSDVPGGFIYWGSYPVKGWAMESAFLIGSTGTALALLAGIDSAEPDWDALLMLRP